MFDRGQPSPPLHDVTVVIVSFFSSHCFEALATSLGQASNIVVVDNSGSPDEVASIQKWLPQARVLQPGKNLGFGAANNLAFKVAKTPYLALVNPDCPATVQDIEALRGHLLKYTQACAVAPQLIDRAGELDVSYRASRTHWISKGPEASGPTCVEYASGAMLLIRKSGIEKIGGFDEKFFLYYEDDDLCLRLTQSCGPLIVIPEVRITHLSRQSSKSGLNVKPEYLRGYHHIQSKFIFQNKHSPRKVGKLQQFRYVATGALEAVIRALLLDVRRCARALGRCLGALNFRPPASLLDKR